MPDPCCTQRKEVNGGNTQGQCCGKNPSEDKFGPFLWVFPGVYWQPLLPDLQPSGEDPTMGGAPSHFFNLEKKQCLIQFA